MHTMEIHDLISPDGVITQINPKTPRTCTVTLEIKGISPYFLGFQIEKELILFNLKSTLAQLGVNGKLTDLELSNTTKSAELLVDLTAFSDLGETVLSQLEEGCAIGKLFAADPRRRVRDLKYLSRMFGRSDREGRPLLTLGELKGPEALALEKIEGRTIAHLPLRKGCFVYDPTIIGLVPTVVRALKQSHLSTRDLLRLSQIWRPDRARRLEKNSLLLVSTTPLHVRTVFGRVVDDLLPDGVHHTTAAMLQPDTMASGDIYELYGESKEELTSIPMEFYTLEPYREHIFFADRTNMHKCLQNTDLLKQAFDTAPDPESYKAATYVVKSDQLKNLKQEDWVLQKSPQKSFPGFFHPHRQSLMVESYITNQPEYPFLKALDEGEITSQGVLFTRYLPSPLMKRHLLTSRVYHYLKGIYFLSPSRSSQSFSHEDRSLLLDLAKFGIPIFWITKGGLLQFVPKPDKDSGMFVPLDQIEAFTKATLIGLYGSNLTEGTLEELLHELLAGLLKIQKTVDHPLFGPDVPLAMVTGGGPGVMSVGNKVAKKLGILSCANVVDFNSETINEQKQNPHIDAKMTFRLDRLVERQAEFHLDLPIFFPGGIGTDFEYSLEEVRRKTGAVDPTPILLFGPKGYWKEKITPRFQSNLKSGTIKGSEWVSNCFFVVQTAEEGLAIYQAFFQGKLEIGPIGPTFEEGFRYLEELNPE